MTDAWVCDTCKSINRGRDSRCYSCGSRKELVASPAGPDLHVEAAIAERSVNAYRSSLPFALVAGGLIAVVAVMGLLLVVEAVRTLDALRVAFIDAVQRGDSALVERVLAQQRQPSAIGLLHFPLTVVAVLAFGAWLSRVCLNLPVLGGGTPSWSPVKALVYPIIPIVNFIKVPGMVQDALYRLDPRAGGFSLVVAAFIGLVGSWLIGVFGAVAISANAVGTITSNPPRDGLVSAFGGLLDQTFLLSVVTELMTATGALLLVVIIARVESRAAARNDEIRAAVLGAGGIDAAAIDAPPAHADPLPPTDGAVHATPTMGDAGAGPQRSVPVYRPAEPAVVPQPPPSDVAKPLPPPPPPQA